MDKIILIAGPTGVGKTAASVSVAKKVGGEIISADSMQIYRKMDIGTAKITQSTVNVTEKTTPESMVVLIWRCRVS